MRIGKSTVRFSRSSRSRARVHFALVGKAAAVAVDSKELQKLGAHGGYQWRRMAAKELRIPAMCIENSDGSEFPSKRSPAGTFRVATVTETKPRAKELADTFRGMHLATFRDT